MSDCDPIDCSPPSSSVHGLLQAKYWSGLPCRSPGDLPNPGIKPASFMSPALAGGFFTTSVTWQIRGGKVEVVTDFISRAPKSPQMVTAATKLKTLSSWKKSYDKHRKHIKKQWHHFANRGPNIQSYGFYSTQVSMWELDHKEGWAPKNWCFQVVLL